MELLKIQRVKDVGKKEHSSIHAWLRHRHGAASECEHCNNKDKKYEYALKHGCEYKKDRNNYLMLCRSCHRKYDYQNRLPNNVRGVIQLTLDMKFVNKYESITEASKETGILIGSIGNCLTGISKRTKKHIWKYEKR